jgi:RNA polymerase sigma factor (sigma-70 family)
MRISPRRILYIPPLWCGVRSGCEQISWLDFKRYCEFLDHVDRCRVFALFNVADVGSIDVSAMREFLLRELHALPQAPDVSSEDFPQLHRLDDDALVEYSTTEYPLQNYLETWPRTSAALCPAAFAMSASDTPAPFRSALAEPASNDLDTLHRAHGYWLFQFLRRRFSKQDAEDLVQETYVRIAGAQIEILNPRAFLAKIATNLARDEARRRAVRPVLVPELDEFQLEDSSLAALPSHQDEDLLLRQMIDILPPKLREAFLLSRVGGLTYAQIADRCGVSVKTIEERMSKALSMCSALLD